MKVYCIKSLENDVFNDDELFWSNGFGWVTDNFDLFSEGDRGRFNLPIGGKWELFFDNDSKVVA